MNGLKYMIGPFFDIEREPRRAIPDLPSWYIGFGFYWFSLKFFKRWAPDITYGSGRLCAWTGFVLYYKPNKHPQEGDLIWLKCKKWLWPDYPKAKVRPLKEKE